MPSVACQSVVAGDVHSGARTACPCLPKPTSARYAAEITIAEKMAAILLWPVGALSAQSAPLSGLRLGWALPLDSVLGPHMRIGALAGPNRQGYGGHTAYISRAATTSWVRGKAC